MHFMLAKDTRRNKFDREWLTGYFVGVATRSGEYLLLKGRRVYKRPTARSRAAGDQCSDIVLHEARADCVKYVKMAPGLHHTQKLYQNQETTDNYNYQMRDLESTYRDDRRFDEMTSRDTDALQPECARLQTGIGHRRPHTSMQNETRDSNARQRGGWRKSAGSGRHDKRVVRSQSAGIITRKRPTTSKRRRRTRTSRTWRRRYRHRAHRHRRTLFATLRIDCCSRVCTYIV